MATPLDETDFRDALYADYNSDDKDNDEDLFRATVAAAARAPLETLPSPPPSPWPSLAGRVFPLTPETPPPSPPLGNQAAPPPISAEDLAEDFALNLPQTQQEDALAAVRSALRRQ